LAELQKFVLCGSANKIKIIGDCLVVLVHSEHCCPPEPSIPFFAGFSLQAPSLLTFASPKNAQNEDFFFIYTKAGLDLRIFGQI
jgi:hypothetical protein